MTAEEWKVAELLRILPARVKFFGDRCIVPCNRKGESSMSLGARVTFSLLCLSLSLGNPPLARPQPATSGQQAQSSADEAALRALVEAFLQAWAAKDLDGYIRVWVTNAPGLESRKQAMQKVFEAFSKIEIKTPLFHGIIVEGEWGRLRVDVEINSVEAKTGKRFAGSGLRKRAMEFARENGSWRILREEAASDNLARMLAATPAGKDREILLDGAKDLWSTDLTLAVNNVGIRFASQGLYPEALNVFRIAQSTAEKINDPKGLAASVGNIGLIHFNQGDYSLALDPLQKSLRLAEAIGDQNLIWSSLNNLGLLHQGQGNFNLAMESYKKSLERAEIQEDKNSIAITLGNIGNLYNGQGDYSSAAEYYQRSRAYYRESGVKAGEGRILHSLGNIQYYQGNFDLALKFYKESLALKQETGNLVEQSRTMNALGLLYTAQGDYKLAEEFHRKSLTINETADTKVEIARSFYSLGGVYFQKGDYDSALEYFRKALKMNQAIGDKRGEGQSLNALAEVYLVQDNLTQAQEAGDRAAELAKQIGNLETLWTALTQAGKAHSRLAHQTQARRSFEEAISTIEALRGRLAGGEQEARRYFEARLSPYHELVGLLIDQKQVGEALACAEQAKARALLDVLRHGRDGIQKAMTVQEQEQERRLKADLTQLNAQFTRATQSDKPDAVRIGDFKSRLEKARLDYEAFRTTLYAVHPELRVQRGEASVINSKELTALLPGAGSALLEYMVTRDRTYLFAITKMVGKGEAEVKVYNLPIKRDELAKQIETFRQQLAERDLGFRVSAVKLYELLIKPAEAQLRGKTNLAIAPDDRLWDLPFQALLTSANRFVAEDAAIAYAPSLTVLREMTKRRNDQRAEAGSTALLALGNPLLGNETINRTALTLRDGKLAPLPEAEQEVEALRRLYGVSRSKVYIGAEAREDRVKEEAGQARILHFAAHGMLNNASPMYSHLALAQGGASEDGLLEAWELMRLDLKADLAVLSACETARGHIGAGEGMIGLSWAMFIAGVPSIVASQWKVESAGTRDLMVNFHRALTAQPGTGKAKSTKSEALRQAAVRLMKNPETRHPFYWAGFVLVGDGI